MDHEASLPDIHRALPLGLRVLLIAFGVAAIGLPLWELGRGLWPLNIATPIFAVIIGGGATVGWFFILAGVRGEGQRWSFPPRTVVVHRSGWRSERETRLMAKDLVAVEVRRSDMSEGPDTWCVVLVPALDVRIDGIAFGDRAVVFSSQDFHTQADAEAVRERIVAHLQRAAM